MKKKVMVALPMGDCQMRGELHSFLSGLYYRQFLEQDFGYLFQEETVLQMSPVEAARNALVHTFLKSECDILWFLDSDNIPHKGAEAVLDGPYDVTIGPVPMLIVAGSGSPVLTPNLFSGYEDTNVGILWEPGKRVVAGGTANMAITRRVMEDKRMWLDDNGSVFKREYGTDGRPLYGEDVDFCRRAMDLGYTIGANEGAICDHAKTFGLDFFTNVLLGQIRRAEVERQGQA